MSQAEQRVQLRRSHFTDTVIPTLQGVQPPVVDESVVAPMQQVMGDLEYAFPILFLFLLASCSSRFFSIGTLRKLHVFSSHSLC